ncbi:MAG: hypothetical protein AB1556_09145 [Bacillota bacterium]
MKRELGVRAMSSGNRVVFQATLGELAEVPGSPYAYWAPKSLRELFQKYPPLDRDVAGQPDKPKIADVKQGLATADDLRFTRFWWEVPVKEIAASREETRQGKKWAPFAKGGKPFYHDIIVVVNWENDGMEIKNFDRAVVRNESFYFREGLAWTKSAWIENSPYPILDVGILPTGSIFTAKRMAIFLSFKEANELILCSFLRSITAAALIHLINPTGRNREAGHLAQVAIIPTIFNENQLSSLAREAYDLLREWDTGSETSTQFIAPWVFQIWRGFRLQQRPVTGHPLAQDFAWSDWPAAREIRGEGKGPWEGPVSLQALAQEALRREGMLRRRLEEIQLAIDEEVYRLYEINAEDRRLIEEELRESLVADEEENVESNEEDESGEEAPEDSATLTVAEHVRRLLHYFAHRAAAADPGGIVPLFDLYLADGQSKPGLAKRVRELLAREFGEGNLSALEEEISSILGKSLDAWLAEDFFGYHLSLYRLHPVIWQLSSQAFAPRRGRAAYKPAFVCFLYWARLDPDTLYKVQQFYLRPQLATVEQEVERLAQEVARAREGPARVRRRREEEYQAALDRKEELFGFAGAISRLLSPPPAPLPVDSRSTWVKEKVNEIVQNGYRPNRDYGVRVNIEPLKQVNILAREAARVKG